MQIANIGWFFRYEAYLVFLLLYALILGLSTVLEIPHTYTLYQIVCTSLLATGSGLCALSIGAWGSDARDALPRASRNIFEQQYQVSRFIDRFYRNRRIAIDDIGLVSFRTELMLTDILGLGSNEIARLWLSKPYGVSPSAAEMNSFLGGTHILISHGFDSTADWLPVASWTIQDNVACSSDRVTFFASDHEELLRLLSNLRSFRAELPLGITETILIQGS